MKCRAEGSAVLLGLAALAACSEGGEAPDSAGASDSPYSGMGFQEICDRLTESDNRFFGVHRATVMKDRYEAARARGAEASELIHLQEQWANVRLRLGEVDPAIETLESLLEQAEDDGLSDNVHHLRRSLGIAYLRRGEVDHCLNRRTADSCMFPIEGDGVWQDTRGAEAAIRQFTAYLEETPDARDVVWLLNLTHMTAGTYPDGVPERFRIAREDLVGSPGPRRFHDIAGDLGLNTVSGAGGAILDDLNGDGLLDVVTSSIFPCLPLKHFRNRGDGTFEDVSDESGLSEQLGGLNCNQTDFDNDGRLDILVLRGAWMGPDFGRLRNSLLHQLPDGTFRDVTEEAGLAVPAYPCQAAAWADYDGDGFLDLCIGNEEFPAQLFHNQGDGTFVDVASAAGIENTGICKGVAWGDYDEDGDPDLYLSNLLDPNRFYRNDGGRGEAAFVDIADELGVRSNDTDAAPHLTDTTFVSWFFDYDNDGRLDLFVGGYGASLGDVAADYTGQESGGTRQRLYRNTGDGFDDVSRAAGLHRIQLPMGANYGDVDGDGWLDIYLGTGKPDLAILVPNVLFQNVGGVRFKDVTTAAGLGHLQKGHGIAFGDIDNDGDQDILAQMGGFYPGDAFHDSLFLNPGHGNRWLTVLLRGVEANRPGIGARLRVDVEGPGGERSIHLVGGPGASFGSSSVQQEIGLGQATRILRLEVRWPGSGTVDIFEDVPLDRFVEVTEGDAELRLLERPTFRLGG